MFLPAKEVAVWHPQHDEEKDEKEEESSWQEIQNGCGQTEGNTGDVWQVWHDDTLRAQSVQLDQTTNIFYSGRQFPFLYEESVVAEMSIS